MNDVNAAKARKSARWNRDRAGLMATIRGCLDAGNPPAVNLSVPRHSVTTGVLRAIAYDRGLRDRGLPVAFADGSRPPPFPLGALAELPAPGSRPEPVVLVGLSSFRHPDLDYLIDHYLTRNKELNDESSMAASEEQTFRRAVELLSDPALDGGGQVWAFHTGLEPMVVGFYRGVVEVLRRRAGRGLPRRLWVLPHLYALDPVTGAVTPDSPGAKLESYVVEQPWW